jgi:nucleotide-binding universal stress UspA family protein
MEHYYWLNMKNILVLTDFSAVADNAAQYAVWFAEGLKADVMLFNANIPKTPIPAMADGTEEDADDFINEDVAIKLGILTEKLNKSLNREDINKPLLNYITKKGAVADCVDGIVKDKKIDLIIMGAHQYNDLNLFLLGNNVKEVINKAKCPVLLIPEQAAFKKIRNISYATDLRYCDVQIIEFLHNLARQFNAAVSLIHVCTQGLPDLLNEEATSIFLDVVSPQIKEPCITFNSSGSNEAELTINQLIEKQEMDILALAYRKNHFFKRIFKSSVDKKDDAFMRIPLLVIPINLI